ncbi:G patch domain-containing protein 4-like [Oppia nitens]|uniref:G patch domain-containing protein 4-like n=1 Tax=Oppia nitens TaxID=1686743 RepID=UPI0023DC87CA|nr:G patch domain-containing protein 4-like [Oppia nitens]
MDFARKQLLSMGWTDGQGLGVNEDGITNAIKPKIKFNKNGIGFEANESANQWWNQSFNCSANYIDFKISQTQSGLKVKEKNSSVDNKNHQKYSNFVKSLPNEDIDDNCDDNSDNNLLLNNKLMKNLDFEEVFRKCKRRTAHKASRIGIKMNGKLKRLKEQDEEFLKKFKKLKQK